MAESHSILENSVVVYKRARSSVRQARLRLDNGTWHRVWTSWWGLVTQIVVKPPLSQIPGGHYHSQSVS